MEQYFETETTNLNETIHDKTKQFNQSTNHLANIYGDQMDNEYNNSNSGLGNGPMLNGRYQLFESIGKGGMGTVYKALDKHDVAAGSSNFIAIKVLNEEFGADPDLFKALHSETKKTRSLSHPNIPKVYDFDCEGETIFMTMEYLEGATLDKRLKGYPHGLPKEDALDILKQICNALSYAHAQGIIHSDLKPSNVFVEKNNHVKVLDFGFARLQNFSHHSNFDPGILEALTPAYASLEMLQGNNIPDARDDIYALACICYEMFTGGHPFNRERIDKCLIKRLEPERPKTLNRTQWQALKNALEFRREDRTESIQSFLRAWEGKPNIETFTLLLSVSAAILALLYGFISGYITLPHLFTQREPIISTAPPAKQTEPLAIVSPTQPSQTTVIPSLSETALNLSANKTNFKIGNELIVRFTVEEPLYVYIAVVDSIGQVNQIYPDPPQKSGLSKPEVHYRLPQASTDWFYEIKKPTGIDKIVAIASKEPIKANELNFRYPEEHRNNHTIVKTLEYSVHQ